MAIILQSKPTDDGENPAFYDAWGESISAALGRPVKVSELVVATGRIGGLAVFALDSETGNYLQVYYDAAASETVGLEAQPMTDGEEVSDLELAELDPAAWLEGLDFTCGELAELDDFIPMVA